MADGFTRGGVAGGDSRSQEKIPPCAGYYKRPLPAADGAAAFATIRPVSAARDAPSLGFTLLPGLLSGLTALGVDMFLPALAAERRLFRRYAALA